MSVFCCATTLPVMSRIFTSTGIEPKILTFLFLLAVHNLCPDVHLAVVASGDMSGWRGKSELVVGDDDDGHTEESATRIPSRITGSTRICPHCYLVLLAITEQPAHVDIKSQIAIVGCRLHAVRSHQTSPTSIMPPKSSITRLPFHSSWGVSSYRYQPMPISLNPLALVGFHIMAASLLLARSSAPVPPRADELEVT